MTRTYQRKFDWDDAKARYANGETIQDIVERGQNPAFNETGSLCPRRQPVFQPGAVSGGQVKAK